MYLRVESVSLDQKRERSIAYSKYIIVLDIRYHL